MVKMSKVSSDKKCADKIIFKNSSFEESTGDTDLFNFLRQMHLTGGANGITVSSVRESVDSGEDQHSVILLSAAQPDINTPPSLTSRKRKAWEGIHAGNNKWVGGQRPPALRSAESEEDHLQTPNCSNTGYEDEEAEETASVDQDRGWNEDQEADVETKTPHLLSPGILNCEDIDADNLAADFDGSFSGLGVDMNTANYSMSEAMITLNNIAVQSQLKDSVSGGKVISLKSEPHYVISNYGALDLSNDDAQHPDSEETPSPQHRAPPTFSGSVSRENSQDAVNNIDGSNGILHNQRRASNIVKNIAKLETPTPPECQFRVPQHQSVILSYSKQDGEQTYRVVATKSEEETEGQARFQYILAAPTSIVTKAGEPSLTYINQGQSYEIKIKKLGDISGHYKKKWLRSTLRLCFNERRLQYIEAEQISEWSRSHPNERILEIDSPLSYGIAEVRQDPTDLSSVSFLWDPTRDTGIFIKVHCISTEFTPKKHGGERGVPFRLQVETFSSDVMTSRLHAGACVLQVFKLKGADRKHKQDREKISKRPVAEQEKFSPQCECTVLTDLSMDSIYVPASRGGSPVQSDSETGTAVTTVTTTPVRGESPQTAQPSLPPAAGQSDNKTWKLLLPQAGSVETTAGWLAYNRYGQHVKTFSNYDARDLLRLSKEELIQLIGLVDGIRLYNDINLKPMAPRLILYLAEKGESLFHPLLLQEVTVPELLHCISQTFQVPQNIGNVIMEGPNRISIKLTDEFLKHQSQDSAFLFSVEQRGQSPSLRLSAVCQP